MKTSVSITSIRAYDLLKAAAFHGQHALILGAMQPGKLYSRREIAMSLGLETSAVAGRCNELLASGQIVECGHIKCPITQRTVQAVRLAGQQPELFQ